MFKTIEKAKLSMLGAAAGLLMASSVANATVITLSNWNTDELQTSNDTVTVLIGNETLGSFTCGSNQICVRWNDGIGTGTPTPKAIITFSYDNRQGSAPSTVSETGGSTSWNFNGSGNADGFGSFDKNNDKGNGNENTAGTTNWLVFGLSSNGASSIISNINNYDFAAHVQYNDNCSGWVSDKVHNDPGSNENCYTGPGRTNDQVPEPSSMMLFGAGLIGLGAWGRKRLK